jgi:hypothetical protein
LDCKPDNIFLIHTDSFQINNILKGFFGNYNPFTKIKCYETLVRDGKFRPTIRNELEAKGCLDKLEINLKMPGGYRGNVEVAIGGPTEKEFEANVNISDRTRFPARIRAAATALRDRGCKGLFQIQHNNGKVQITKIQNPEPNLAPY